jgi:hypothetical protein
VGVDVAAFLDRAEALIVIVDPARGLIEPLVGISRTARRERRDRDDQWQE